MRTWILHVGEELPVDPDARLFRYGHLAEELQRRGHTVTRWAPTFQHFRKQQRFESDHRYGVSPGYEIQFVHAPGYQRNVSFARWRCYRVLGQRLARLFQHEPEPDLIVTGIPSLEWCQAAVDYGRTHGIPVVLDVRDLWPDVFLQAAPRWARPIGSSLLWPLARQAQAACRNASAICGVSRSYLDWGLRQAGRPARPQDRVFPLGYLPPAISESDRARETASLIDRGVDPGKTISLFVGGLGDCYDVATIIEAAMRLEASSPGAHQVVICGRGSDEPRWADPARRAGNVITLGWVTPKTIAALMPLASIGLAAYAPGAPQRLPNKPFEYMAGGLAVVTSLPGELPELLSEHRCGATYTAGDASSLEQTLRRIAADDFLLQQCRERSRRLYDSKFRADRISTDFADYLEGLAVCELMQAA